MGTVITEFHMDKGDIFEASLIHGPRPKGSFVVGWVDFNAEKGGDSRERRFALLLTRSGRFVAVRGDSMRPLPPLVFPNLRLMLS